MMLSNPSTISSQARRVLARVWALALATLLACSALGVGMTWAPASAQAQEGASVIEQAKAHYGRLGAQVEALRQQRQELEGAYRALSQQITRAKRAGANEQLIGGMRLERLLEEGRVLADRLYTLQRQLRDAEAEREQARGRVLEAYNQQIAVYETRALDPNLKGKRASLLAKLNTLRQERHGYLGRAEMTPDLKLSALPSLNDPEINDPDEALAAAAELEDENRKLKRHIGDLDSEIARLERARRLRQKNADFRDQEAFFDENIVGGRRIARGSNGARSQADTDRGNSGGGKGGVTGEDTNTAGSPTSDSANNIQAGAGGNNDRAGNNAAAPPDEQFNNAGGGTDALSGDDGNAAGGGGGFETDGDVGDPNVGAPPSVTGTPTDLPNAGLPGDPFGSSGVVVKDGIDEEGLGGVNAPAENESLEQRLRRLKRERDAFNRKSNQVRKRAEDLRRKADAL